MSWIEAHILYCFQHEISDYILDLNNPVIYVILFNGLLFLITILVFKTVYLPIKKKHLIEKYELERRNEELMALFAELDPDPLIRVDSNGIITQINESATKEFSLTINTNTQFKSAFPELDIDFNQLITSKVITRRALDRNNRHYLVDIKGVDWLSMAQIYFHNITERVLYEREIENYKNRLKVLSEYLDSQQEELKERVSRILHDDVGQRIFSLKLLTQKYESCFGDQKTYNKILDEFDTAYQELRELSHELKPLKMNELGIVSALRDLVESYNSSTNIEGSLFASEDNFDLSNKLKNCLFRVAQEAIINIIKHSKADEYLINLNFKNDQVKMIISDNGIGAKNDSLKKVNYFNTGIGLFNIKERVEYLEGEVKIETSPKEGFTLIVILPII